ncbi:hypothetical protein ACBJ59_52230 [Nonomuraea sp. MTCD27]
MHALAPQADAATCPGPIANRALLRRLLVHVEHVAAGDPTADHLARQRPHPAQPATSMTDRRMSRRCTAATSITVSDRKEAVMRVTAGP